MKRAYMKQCMWGKIFKNVTYPMFYVLFLFIKLSTLNLKPLSPKPLIIILVCYCRVHVNPSFELTTKVGTSFTVWRALYYFTQMGWEWTKADKAFKHIPLVKRKCFTTPKCILTYGVWCTKMSHKFGTKFKGSNLV